MYQIPIQIYRALPEKGEGSSQQQHLALCYPPLGPLVIAC